MNSTNFYLNTIFRLACDVIVFKILIAINKFDDLLMLSIFNFWTKFRFQLKLVNFYQINVCSTVSILNIIPIPCKDLFLHIVLNQSGSINTYL